MGLRSQNNPIASFRDVFSATGTDAMKEPGIQQGITATGGVINDYVSGNKVFRTHIFTSSGTFDVTKLSESFPNAVDFLVVAGGGGGGLGSHTGGGGGGGGFRTSMPEAPGGPSTNAEARISALVQSYSITVGGGGSGGYSNNNDTATQGTPSYIGPPAAKIVESIGGGKGSDGPGQSGGPGGSGGGAAGDLQNTNAGSAVTPTQGFPGGSCQNSAGPSYAGGGGGGAGQAGFPGVSGARSATNGNGGEGKRTTITGPAYSVGTPGPAGSGGYLAGGGATGSENPVTYRSGPQAPGPGGGGNGNNPGQSSNGVAGTGGGGGGGDPTAGNYNGGFGGSGLIVLRYQIAETETNTAKATGGNISFYNGKTIHTFVSSGTFTAPATFNETVEYVVVGGGGAGGGTDFRGGGGGAGSVRHNTVSISGPSTTNVQIGGGGSYVTPNGPGGNGTPSYFGTPINSSGGGMGGGYASPYAGSPGGSGGGAGGHPGGSGGAAGTDPGSALGNDYPGNSDDVSPGNGWGYPGGGRGSEGKQQGGGGGGAGGRGIPSDSGDYPTTYGLGGPGVQLPTTFRNPELAPSGTGGTSPRQPGVSGGLGYQSPTGTNWYVAGGGNGGGYSKDYGTPSNSGVNVQVEIFVPSGGGGAGAVNGPGNSSEPEHPVRITGWPGAVNSGSGGGGSSPQYDGVGPGQGGSGIVMVAYPT